jgi:hypothetical protein
MPGMAREAGPYSLVSSESSALRVSEEKNRRYKFF